MTNINAEVVETNPIGGATNAGVKTGYFVAAVKAAQNDTVTLTNITTIIDADVRIDATGAAEPYTKATNVLTLTSATTGSVRGKLVYK